MIFPKKKKNNLKCLLTIFHYRMFQFDRFSLHLLCFFINTNRWGRVRVWISYNSNVYSELFHANSKICRRNLLVTHLEKPTKHNFFSIFNLFFLAHGAIRRMSGFQVRRSPETRLPLMATQPSWQAAVCFSFAKRNTALSRLWFVIN